MRIGKTIAATLTAVAIMLACVSVAPQRAAAQYGAYRALTFAERVSYQRVIEDVY